MPAFDVILEVGVVGSAEDDHEATPSRPIKQLVHSLERQGSVVLGHDVEDGDLA
jgi:hypothetical protein